VLWAFPAWCAAESAIEANLDHGKCVDSMISILADQQPRDAADGRSGAFVRSGSSASFSDACIDFFIEQLADYEEQHQVQRGKPQPPPPPPPGDGGPPARAWHAFTGNGSKAADASRLYLFGGAGSDWQAVPSDLWYYRIDQAKWLLAPTGSAVPGRRQHAGFSCGAGLCVTSNGSSGVSLLKETWIYTASSGSWAQANCKRRLCPSARQMPAMAYDVARAYHVLFGGLDGDGSLDDTYTFAGGLWTARSPATKPTARDRAAAAFVESSLMNMVVLFGGQQDESEVLCDMFAWTGSDWAFVTPANQGPCLHSHSIAWDRDRLVVTGGYVDTHDTPSNEVWYFTFTGKYSGTWSQAGGSLASCAAGVKPGARMAYDAPSRKKVFFGGEQNSGSGVIRYDDTVVCP